MKPAISGARRESVLGFTLVEALTIIGVMAILVAILLPVVARVREKGRQAACQSYLKQIALGMQQYVQDFDGKYPAHSSTYDPADPQRSPVYWPQRIEAYVKNKQVFICPDVIHELGSGNWSNGTGTFYHYNNAVIERLNTSPPTYRVRTGLNETVISNPADTFLNYDMIDGKDPVVPVPPSCGSGSTPVPTLHSGGANYSFYDGHVKWLSPREALEIGCANPINPQTP